MQLSKAAEMCYEITNSYLHIDQKSQIIASTQEAIRLTRKYLLSEIFVRWSPLNGEISFSYNGGKDCQVLLLLYLSCLWEYFFIKAQNSQFDFEFQSFPMQRLPTVFIDQEETFPTLENFVWKPQSDIAFPYTNHKGNLVHRSIWQTHLEIL